MVLQPDYRCAMIRAFSFSAAGGHAVNEDAFDLHQGPNDTDRWLVAVADGQGGRAGGGAAAQLACLSVRTFAQAKSWAERLSLCDAAVAAMPGAGFTTLVSFEIHGNTLIGASCGDSAALAQCGSGQFLELTKHQFKNPPVGSGEADFIPFEVELVPPWKVLTMTDGVWKYAGWQRIRELATRFFGEELIAQLQAAARLRSGGFPDDFTVVLLEGE